MTDLINRISKILANKDKWFCMSCEKMYDTEKEADDCYENHLLKVKEKIE